MNPAGGVAVALWEAIIKRDPIALTKHVRNRGCRMDLETYSFAAEAQIHILTLWIDEPFFRQFRLALRLRQLFQVCGVQVQHTLSTN